MRWVTLLKGFNLGKNRMPAPDLRKLFEANGYANAKTLLASGNIVFDTDASDGATLEAAIEQMLADKGLKVAAVVRNAKDLRAAIAANPFPDAAEDHPNHLLLHFHREAVPDAPLAALADVHDGPERLQAAGRTLYVDYPEDVGHSTLPQAMTKAKFPKIATARNWNTVVKLLEMLEA